VAFTWHLMFVHAIENLYPWFRGGWSGLTLAGAVMTYREPGWLTKITGKVMTTRFRTMKNITLFFIFLALPF